jgi:hypothetical protein
VKWKEICYQAKLLYIYLKNELAKNWLYNLIRQERVWNIHLATYIEDRFVKSFIFLAHNMFMFSYHSSQLFSVLIQVILQNIELLLSTKFHSFYLLIQDLSIIINRGNGLFEIKNDLSWAFFMNSSKILDIFLTIKNFQQNFVLGSLAGFEWQGLQFLGASA